MRCIYYRPCNKCNVPNPAACCSLYPHANVDLGQHQIRYNHGAGAWQLTSHWCDCSVSLSAIRSAVYPNYRLSPVTPPAPAPAVDRSPQLQLLIAGCISPHGHCRLLQAAACRQQFSVLCGWAGLCRHYLHLNGGSGVSTISTPDYYYVHQLAATPQWLLHSTKTF